LPTGVDGTFESLTDTPTDYTGNAGKIVKVNAGEDALEYGDISTELNSISIDELTDVDTTTTSPSNAQILRWNGNNWEPSDENTYDDSDVIKSVENTTTGEIRIASIVQISQDDYNSLSVKDTDKLYIIIG
jgi:hypothetical protein